MRRPMVALMLLSLTLPTSAAEGPIVPEGKTLTDRAIELGIVVEAPPARVYEMWTSPELLKTWFGADAVVDGAPGGKYEIYFMPRERWDGKTRVGSHGAKLIAAEPGKRVAFEWTMPPFAEELNEAGLPTWVDVTLEPVGEARTHVHFRHLGFPRGGKWDQAYEYFVTAWGTHVLPNLDEALGASPAPAPAPAPSAAPGAAPPAPR